MNISKIFLIMVTLFLSVDGNGQSITWQRMYDGPMHHNDNGNDVCFADNGNFFIVGSTLSQSSGFKIYLLKINPYGDTLWTKILTNVNADVSLAIVSTADGGCVFTGGSVPLTLKIDSNGNVVWYKTYSGYGQCWDLIKANNGGYIACGEQINANRDGYILKIDSIGNFQWQRTYPSLFAKSFKSIVNSNDGSYILTGYNLDYYQDTNEALITKIDSIGNVIWEKHYKFNYHTFANTIIRVGNGYMISGTNSEWPNLNIHPYILRINSSGNIIYSKTFTEIDSVFGTILNYINNNKFVFASTLDTIGLGYCKLLIIDSIGTILNQKTLLSKSYKEISSILPLLNNDILFVGINDDANPNNNRDIFAIRTDSLLNAPQIGIRSINSHFPTKNMLFPSFPNPFNANTNIHFQVSKYTHTTIIIYDVSGKEIIKLLDNIIKGGEYILYWNASELSSGLYFCVLNFNNEFSLTQKLILLK